MQNFKICNKKFLTAAVTVFYVFDIFPEKYENRADFSDFRNMFYNSFVIFVRFM